MMVRLPPRQNGRTDGLWKRFDGAARAARYVTMPKTAETELVPLQAAPATVLEHRPMTERDIPCVAAAFCQAYAGEPWRETWCQKDAEAYLSELLSMPHARCHVAYTMREASAMFVAACFARRRTWQGAQEWYVDTFFVAPSHQHEGAGTWFLAKMRAIAAAEGSRHIALHTARGYPAEFFYRKNGFAASPQTLLMVAKLD